MVLPPGSVLEPDDDPKGDILPPTFADNPDQATTDAMRMVRLAAELLIREGTLPQSFTGYVNSTDLANAVAALQAWVMENFFSRNESGDLVLAVEDIAGLVDALAVKSNVGHTHSIAEVALLQAALDALAADIDALEAGSIGLPIDISDVSGLQAILDDKLESPIAIADVTGLQAALDAVATLPIDTSDVTGLDAALATIPTLPIDTSDVTGLDAALATIPTLPIAISDVTGLDAALATIPTLPIAISDVTGLVADLASKAAATHTHPVSDITGRPFNVMVYLGGLGANAEEVFRGIIPACSIPSGGTGTHGTARVAATASTTYELKKNGTQFGTLVWAISATAATVTISSTTTFNGTSDVLTIEGPATADATLEDIGIRMAGTYT